MEFYCLCCGGFFDTVSGHEAAKEYAGMYGDLICPVCTANEFMHLTMKELEELKRKERKERKERIDTDETVD